MSERYLWDPDDWPEEDSMPLPRLTRLWSRHAFALSPVIVGQMQEACGCTGCRMTRLLDEIAGGIAERQAEKQDERRHFFKVARQGGRRAAWRISRRRR